MERNENILLNPESEITLGDLRGYHRLEVRCFACKWRSSLDPTILRARFKDRQRLVGLEEKLRCINCGNRRRNRFALRGLPRD